MFREDKWPFIATRLSEIIDKERLSVIQAGSSARLGRAITILDYDSASGSFRDRIDSFNSQQNWDPFCALLRDVRYVQGGNLAWQECDLREGPQALERFRSEGKAFRSFACHMGLSDATHVIVVCGRPVALLHTGQHRPPEGADEILKRVDALGTEQWQHIRLDEGARADPKDLARVASSPRRFRGAARARHFLVGRWQRWSDRRRLSRDSDR